MKLELRWEDGHERTEYDVVEFSQEWAGDEWLVTVKYRGGETDHFTGRKPIATKAEEIHGETQPAEEIA